jgi:hypothetical protein
MTPEAQRIAIAEACGKHRVKLKTYPGYGGEKRPLWSWCCHGPVTKVGKHFEMSCCDSTVGYTNSVYECDFCGKKCNEAVAHVSEVPAKGSPDYLSDLNAMHEAEKMLTPQQQSDYSFSLSAGWMSDRRDNWRGCHATATQRAEAFLRTLNFWKDNQNGKP